MFGQSYNLFEEQSIMNLPVVWFEQQRELVHIIYKLKQTTNIIYMYTQACVLECSRMF